MARYPGEEEDLSGGYDVNSGDTMTVRGVPSVPPMPTMPVQSTDTGFKANSGLPLLPPVQPISSRQSNSVPPPTGGQNDLSAFLAQQKSELNKYGPEQQMAVQQDIINRQNTLRNRATQGLAGFGDALISISGHESPGFMKSMQDKQAAQGAAQMSTMQNAQAGKIAQLNQQMKLGEADPSSPLSRMAQKANESTLVAAGVPKQAISFMPASLISDIGTKNITLMDDKQKIALEQAYRMAGLGLQADTLKATVANQQAGRQHEAAKEYGGMGVWKRATGNLPLIGNPAMKVLKQEMSGAPPPSSMVTIKASDGSMHMIPQENIEKAKARDPGLTVQQ